MPDEIAKALQELTAEYEAAETLESKVAHDADKIETLLQAAEYETQGYATGPWCDTSIQALRTESAKQLAQAIVTSDPRSWWTGTQRATTNYGPAPAHNRDAEFLSACCFQMMDGDGLASSDGCRTLTRRLCRASVDSRRTSSGTGQSKQRHA
jgi:hypothetical protein